jgi:hypothetical protein
MGGGGFAEEVDERALGDEADGRDEAAARIAAAEMAAWRWCSI